MQVASSLWLLTVQAKESLILCVFVCVCLYLIRFGLQVFEVFFGSRQTLVVGHVPLHHLVIGVFQQEGVGGRHRLGQVVGLGEITQSRGTHLLMICQ